MEEDIAPMVLSLTKELRAEEADARVVQFFEAYDSSLQIDIEFKTE